MIGWVKQLEWKGVFEQAGARGRTEGMSLKAPAREATFKTAETKNYFSNRNQQKSSVHLVLKSVFLRRNISKELKMYSRTLESKIKMAAAKAWSVRPLRDLQLLQLEYGNNFALSHLMTWILRWKTQLTDNGNDCVLKYHGTQEIFEEIIPRLTLTDFFVCMKSDQKSRAIASFQVLPKRRWNAWKNSGFFFSLAISEIEIYYEANANFKIAKFCINPLQTLGNKKANNILNIYKVAIKSTPRGRVAWLVERQVYLQTYPLWQYFFGSTSPSYSIFVSRN